jgi:acetyl-CoA carboxylase biotin carboxyl carrier protein
VSEQPEVELIRRLMTMVEQYGLEEIEAEEGGLRVRLTALDPSGVMDSEPISERDRYRLWQPPSFLGQLAAAASAEAGSTRPETAEPLHAPVSGTFYRAPNTDAPPFIEVGQAVEVGDTVGLIEAMKVFSEITADRAGVVVEITAENGKVVQHGDVLLYIDPIAS